MRAVIAILAGIEAGSTVIPMSPDAGPRERDHVLADSGANLLVDASGDHDLAPDVGRPAPSVPLVLYTSGTTGPPKGVPLTRAAIAVVPGRAGRGLGLDPGRRPRPRPAPASRARPGPRCPRAAPRRVGAAPHRATHRRQLRRRPGLALLRRPHRLVAHLRGPGRRGGAARCAPAGVGERCPSRPGLRRAARAVRPGAGGAIRDDGDADHARRPLRRAAPARQRRSPAPGHRGAGAGRGGRTVPSRRGRCPRGARTVGLRRLPAPPRCHRRLVHRLGMVPDRRRGRWSMRRVGGESWAGPPPT